MTTTSTSQGYDVNKPTSKVLAPPGGKSNISLFGGYGGEEEKKEVKSQQISNVFGGDQANESSPKKEKPQNISNVFASGDDDAQQQANKNKAKAQESSQNRLFGGPDDESKPSGKGRDGDEEKDKEDEETNGEEKKEESSPSKATLSPQQKGRGTSNLLSHEAEPQKAPEPVKPKRQPPGGASSGLW